MSGAGAADLTSPARLRMLRAMIQPWRQVRSEPIGDFRVFRLTRDRRISPRTGAEHDFYILHAPNWVNVVALTPDRRVVMVEQYRHGSETVELEIPGGIMDPHEQDPLAAGLRELREETGYEGEQGRLIGQIHSNPAILTNTTFTVLVENCHHRHELELDHGEDLVTRLVPLDEIPELIRTGKIGHSLVVVALYHYELMQHEKR